MPDEQTPLRMTLEEQELVVNVLRNYHRDHTGDPEFGEWPQVARELAERFRQQLQPPQRDDTTDLMTAYMVGVSHGQDAKRDLTAELIAQLAECCRLSGADTGDDGDWRLAPRAVEEVRQLRQDYDELSQTEGELVEALEAFFEASDNYMPEQDGFYQEALTNLRAAFARAKGDQP